MIQAQINAYIESKELAWAKTTLRTERARLNCLTEAELYNPRAAFLRLRKEMGAYSVKTLFTRVSSFHDWLIRQRVSLASTNPYREFMVENANLFKNVYKKEVVNVSYAEAVALINTLTNESVRLHALHILKTGLRFTESLTESGGFVVGKGSKSRRVFGASSPNGITKPTYATFRNALKTVGLKPHTLRKLFASELVNKGVTAPDLMAVLGWSNMQTAASYLQSRKNSELDNFVRSVTNG